MPFADIRLLRNQDHGPWIGVAGKRKIVLAALFVGVVLLHREDRASGHRHVRIVEFDPSGIESGIRAEIELRPLGLQLVHRSVAVHPDRTAGGHLFDRSPAALVNGRIALQLALVVHDEQGVLAVVELAVGIDLQVVDRNGAVVVDPRGVRNLHLVGHGQHARRRVVDSQTVIHVEAAIDRQRTVVYDAFAADIEFPDGQLAIGKDVDRSPVGGGRLNFQGPDLHLAARQYSQFGPSDVERRKRQFAGDIEDRGLIGAEPAVEIQFARNLRPGRDQVFGSGVKSPTGSQLVALAALDRSDHGFGIERRRIGRLHFRIIGHRTPDPGVRRQTHLRRSGSLHRSARHGYRAVRPDHLHRLRAVGQGGLDIEVFGPGVQCERRPERHSGFRHAPGRQILRRKDRRGVNADHGIGWRRAFHDGRRHRNGHVPGRFPVEIGGNSPRHNRTVRASAQILLTGGSDNSHRHQSRAKFFHIVIF